MSPPSPHLTDQEIDDICAGLMQYHAMVRYLRGQGFEVKVKPNGRPLLSRANFEAVMAGQTPQNAAPSEPRSANIIGLREHFLGRRRNAAT